MSCDDDAELVEGSAAEEQLDADDELAEAAGGFDHWRKESTIGGIGTGIARGLQSVFGSPRHEIAIVAEVPGEPPDADTRLRVILDPDDPTKSIAVVPATPHDNTPADPPRPDPTAARPCAEVNALRPNER